MTELLSMAEDSIDDIHKTSFHNAQSSIQSVVDNVVQYIVLDLLREYVIREMSDGHVSNFIDIYAVATGFSKRLLAFSSFMAPIATFVRVKWIQILKKSSTVPSICQRS